MSIVATAVLNDPNYKSWTLTGLAADTTLTIPHGFGVIPDLIMIESLLAASATAGFNVVTGTPADATNIYFTKTAAVGSGGASPGVTLIAKVTALRPNTSGT